MFDREEQGDYECKVCSAPVADRHNYCAVHYQEALEKYQDDLQDYDQALAEWKSLSEDERLRRNTEHDQKHIRSYAVVLTLIICITLCVLTQQSAEVTGGLSVASALVMWFTRPLYSRLGRLGRGLKRGLLYTAVTVSLVWFGLLFTQGFTYQQEALMGIGILCVVFGLWRESLGIYHVTAQPQPPVRPKP